MSDDDEIVYVKKQKTIHYGSLEDSERIKQLKSEIENIDSGQIHISKEYFDIENEM